jgi:hypothetical protein
LTEEKATIACDNPKDALLSLLSSKPGYPAGWTRRRLRLVLIDFDALLIAWPGTEDRFSRNSPLNPLKSLD